MDIFIHVNITQKNFPLRRLSKFTKIKDIKARLELEAGLPVHVQRLQYLDSADLRDDTDLKNNDVVHLATIKLKIWRGWEKIVGAILDEKVVNLEAELAEDWSKCSAALFIAVNWGKSDIVNMLVEKMESVNGKTPFGRTVLHAAAVNGNTDLVEKLIQKGADIHIKDKDDQRPLNIASKFGNKDVERQLFLCQWKERTDKIRHTKDESPLMMHQQFDSGYPTWMKGECAQVYMCHSQPSVSIKKKHTNARHSYCDQADNPLTVALSTEPSDCTKEMSALTMQGSQKALLQSRERKNANSMAHGLISRPKSQPPRQPSSKSIRVNRIYDMHLPGKEQGKVIPQRSYQTVMGRRQNSRLSAKESSIQDKGKAPAIPEAPKKKIGLYEEWKYLPSFSKRLIESEQPHTFLLQL